MRPDAPAHTLLYAARKKGLDDIGEHVTICTGRLWEVVEIGVPFVMQVETGNARECITKKGISADLNIAERIVAYAIARMAYPKMSGRSLWAVLERIW